MSQTRGSLLFITVAVTLMAPGMYAQRSPYAGSRPTGGLSQKDKYIPSPEVIASRFGSIAGNNTPTSTLPPAPIPPPNTHPVVYPESAYIPLPAAPIFPEPGVSSRFGGNTANAVSGANASAGAAAPPVFPNRLPFDAHGDRELINQLSRLPAERQPFWFLNYQAIEAHRNATNPVAPGGLAPRGSFAG